LLLVGWIMNDLEIWIKNVEDYCRRFGWLNVRHDYEHDRWELIKLDSSRVPLFDNLETPEVDNYIKSSLELDRDLLKEQSNLFQQGLV